MPMPKSMRDKWVAALRSGAYRQARNQLFDGAAYCCLGVLAKECLGATFEPKTDEDVERWELEDIEDTKYKAIIGDEVVDVMLPDAVAHELFDRVRVPGAFGSDPLAGHLAALNDKGCGFSYIADVIEKKVPVVPDGEEVSTSSR